MPVMVSREDIQKLADQIAAKFSPERIILFGSYAYGTPHERSDVDMLVVMPFRGSTFGQALVVWDAVRPAFDTDFIVRTPQDVQRRYEQFDPLIREALTRGITLYERRVARVA